MNKKIFSKVVATMLVITLTLANIILLGVYANNTYAMSENLEKQGITTNNENVEFDAYFVNENKTKIHSIKQDINKQDTKLYISVNVKRGYLKDALIKIFGDKEGSYSNFKLLNSDESLELIQKIDLDKNEIALKQINQGTQAIIELPIVANKDDKFDVSNFIKENAVQLKGSFVNDEGKTINISKTIKVKVEWNGQIKVSLEQGIQRYIPYNIKDEKGIILQTVVKAGLENNNLPIEQTTLDVIVPQINNQKPEKVSVIANSTKATNGKEVTQFNNDNWNYNAEAGTLNITVKNEAQDNIVSWQKNAIDEYVITYIYKLDTQEAVQTEQTVKATIKAYNNVETIQEAQVAGKVELKDKVGEIVDVKNTSTKELSKGYLYTNSEKETIYNIETKIDIGYSEVVDELVINNETDQFVNAEGIKDIANNSYYKETSIKKELFQKMLGEDGQIIIKDKDGNILTTFNKETTEDENGNYTYNYEGKTDKIIIQTTKPIQEGKIQIYHKKALQGSTNYQKAQLQSYRTLQTNTNVKANFVQNEIANINTQSDITLIDPVTRIEASVSNENLSTVVKNENVQIRVILKTNNIDCDLYKNPVIEVVLPTYVENIDIKDINLLFDEELKIKNYELYKNQSGNTVIKVIIEGEDTKYNTDEVSKGANIVISSDITLKQLTPTKEDVMKVYVTNENATSYETTQKLRSVPTSAYVETKLNSVAPVGMVTTNSVANYNAKGETVTSISGQNSTGKLETKTEAKVATVTMNVINNYNNVAKNVSILGRVLGEKSKDAVSNEELGSNLQATLKDAITVSGVDASKVTIYYSTNESATKDLNQSSNGWTKEVTDYSKVKSYLIVLSNNEMNTGDNITVSYNVDIPENLQHNQSAYANYVVDFDNVTKSQTIKDTAKSATVGLTTGAGPELEAEIEAVIQNGDSLEDGDEVSEGTRITYIISVTNVGKSDVNNVVVKGKVPYGTNYTEFVPGGDYWYDEYVEDYYKREFSQTIETLKVGETKTVEYNVVVKTLSDEEIEDEDGNLAVEEVYAEAYGTITADGLEKAIQTNSIRNKVKEGFLSVEMSSYPTILNGMVKEGETIRYTTTITNVSQKERENVVASSIIPGGTTYKTAYILKGGRITEGVDFEEDVNAVTWDIGELEAEEVIRVVLEVTVDRLPTGLMKKDIKHEMEVTCDGTDEIFSTNEIINRVIVQSISVSVSDNKPEGKLTDEDTIEYYVKIKNTGTEVIENIVVTDSIPKQLSYQKTKYTIEGEATPEIKTGKDTSVVTLNLEPGKTIEITVIAKANEVTGENAISATNEILVECKSIGFYKKYSSTHEIQPTNKDIEGPDGTVQPRRYNISGVAWIDENKDGKRDAKEPKLENIKLMLINAETGETVKDEARKAITTTTDKNGSYIFENIERGKYIVVFVYDTKKYDLTKYKAEGINDSINSDAITMKMSLDGEEITGAVSDNISLFENIYNIDIGLIENPKFDLKLDKFITKITVNNSKGTKVHDYKETQLAKLDLDPKTINDTTLVIEYKIKVTNEGALAGYVKKIVDYIPQDVKFTSEINKDWYAAENGNVYNASLANTLLQPGETKELTLVLTKKMTQNNTGVINNNAEIYEAYNDLGIQDIDSTPANSVQNEDDMSRADAIIGVKTGEVYVYIVITLISIGILGVGIYLINKKVLRRI